MDSETQKHEEYGNLDSLHKTIGIIKAFASLIVFVTSVIVIYFNIVLELNTTKAELKELKNIQTLKSGYSDSAYILLKNDNKELRVIVDKMNKEIILNTNHRINSAECLKTFNGRSK